MVGKNINKSERLVRFFIVCLVAVAGYCNAAGTDAYELNIPEQDAPVSLNILAEKFDHSLIYSHKDVKGINARPLQGVYTLPDALSALFQGTPIRAVVTKRRVIVVSVAHNLKQQKSGKTMKMKKSNLFLGVMAALTTAFGVNAEEAKKDDSREISEEIVVKGIGGSIKRARDAKKNSDIIGDSYFAEDIGKSSDESITEALQRLPGVTLEAGGQAGNQTDPGEPDEGTIIIRGIAPSLNLVKFNGITLTSNTDSQAVNLTNFSADVLTKIVVAKSAQAKQEEGSLGGTVYLESAKPLEQNDAFVVSAEGRHNQLADSSSPRLAVSFSQSLSEEFGVAGSFFWDDAETRNDSYETFLGAFARPYDAVDEDGNALGTVTALSDGFNNYGGLVRNSNKFGGTIAAQFRPSEETEVRVDLAYSDQDNSFILNRLRGSGTTFGATNTATFVPFARVDTETGRLIEAESRRAGLIQTRQQQGDTQNFVFGLDVEHQVGDLTLNGKFAHSSTDQAFQFQNWNMTGIGLGDAADVGTGNLCGWELQNALDGPARLPVYEFCENFDPFDATNLGLNGGSRARRNVTDDLNGLYFDVNWAFNEGFITSIDAGVKATQREKDVSAAENQFGGRAIEGFVNDGFIDPAILDDLVNAFSGGTNGNRNTLPISALPGNGVEDFLMRAPSGVLAGIAPGPSIGGYLVPNVDAINAYLFGPDGLPDEVGINPPNRQWNIEEDTQAIYVQANWEAGQFSGDFGARYVQTEVTTTNAFGFTFNSNFITPNGDNYPATFSNGVVVASHEYSNFLPSFNVRWRATDELIVRGSIGRVMARPRLDDVAQGGNIRAGNVQFLTGDGGNTFLDPFVSDQIDLSVEWYFNENGVLAGGFFRKEIEDFTFQSTTNRNFENPVTGEPCLVDRANAPVDRVNDATVAEFGCADVTFTTRVNGAEATINGFELVYTQVYDFLPGAAQYLGSTISYTYADSEAQVSEDETSIENGFPFPQTSENSINPTLFWDNGDVSLRLAYTYRDESLARTNNNNALVARDSRGILDFSANWRASDNLTVFFSATNLTDSFDYLYENTLVSADPATIPVTVTGTDVGALRKDAPFRLNHTGRSFRLGARYSF